MKTGFKVLAVLVISMLLASCNEMTSYRSPDGKWYSNYDDYVNETINSMAPPIILIGKDESFGYRITVIDSKNAIQTFGNLSLFANTIGKSHNVGDTIIKAIKK